MSEWIKCSERLPETQEETKIFVLLKEQDTPWMPETYEQRIKKATWIPQRSIFVIACIEDAIHLIDHWQPLPLPPSL